MNNPRCVGHTQRRERNVLREAKPLDEKGQKNILKIFCTVVQKEKEEKTFGRNIEAKMRGKKDIWR